MTSIDIDSFLAAEISSNDLTKIIDRDVNNYLKSMTEKGSTINLNFFDNAELNINVTKFKRLIEEVLNGNLTNIHLAYLCDCLTLAEDINYENEQVHELIFELADPEINGGYKSLKELEGIYQRIEN